MNSFIWACSGCRLPNETKFEWKRITSDTDFQMECNHCNKNNKITFKLEVAIVENKKEK